MNLDYPYFSIFNNFTIEEIEGYFNNFICVIEIVVIIMKMQKNTNLYY